MIYPSLIILEPTNQCNARCPSCPRKYSTRPLAEHMDLKLVRKIINEVKALSQPVTYGLCGIGEPMLHPQFDEIARMSSELVWSLPSNGEVLGDHIPIILETKPRDIGISIDATTTEIHAKMRTGLHFNRVVANTLKFLNAIRGSARWWDHIWIQMIVCKVNYHQVYEFVNTWLPRIEGIPGVEVFIKPISPWPEHRANPYYGDAYEFDPPLQAHPQLTVLPLNPIAEFRKDCVLMDTTLQIHSDGVVSPCCMNADDVYHIGNVKNNTIVELFNNARMNELRTNIHNKNYHLNPWCKDCI